MVYHFLPFLTYSCSIFQLEDDISELLGDENKITSTKQALELTRLMVKTETIDDRITLLKIVRVSRKKSFSFLF